MTENNLLQLNGVGKQYHTPGAPATEVLKGIDLGLSPGESMAIVGPSGSGKTTLLNIIGTLDAPTEGELVFDGRSLADLTDKQLARVRNRDLGFIFQLHHLLPQCTVLENVLLPTLAGKGGEDMETRALELLERVGMRDFAASTPARLSGGESQRVAVVRALINGPKLILADEPTGSLDSRNSEKIADLLASLNQEINSALIVVTHSESLAERMDRQLVLEDGRLVEHE